MERIVSSSTASDGSPRRDFAGRPDDPDHVAEVHVDLARTARVAHELDTSGAVDEVEEDELSHLAAGHHPAGETPRILELASGLDSVGCGAKVGNCVPIRKSLRRRHTGQPNRLQPAPSAEMIQRTQPRFRRGAQ